MYLSKLVEEITQARMKFSVFSVLSVGLKSQARM
jgi:hypothetical protein